jgi:hypothetical protein
LIVNNLIQFGGSPSPLGRGWGGAEAAWSEIIFFTIKLSKNIIFEIKLKNHLFWPHPGPPRWGGDAILRLTTDSKQENILVIYLIFKLQKVYCWGRLFGIQ